MSYQLFETTYPLSCSRIEQLKKGSIGCPETSVTNTLRCVTFQKIEALTTRRKTETTHKFEHSFIPQEGSEHEMSQSTENGVPIVSSQNFISQGK
jgi:hypothetical protein